MPQEKFKNLANLETLSQFRHSKELVNSDLEDYLYTHDKTCAGCVVCLNQRKKILSFKYPKSVKSRYVELYTPFNVQK